MRMQIAVAVQQLPAGDEALSDLRGHAGLGRHCQEEVTRQNLTLQDLPVQMKSAVLLRSFPVPTATASGYHA